MTSAYRSTAVGRPRRSVPNRAPADLSERLGVPQALAEMIAYRGRVVRQIAGAPLAAAAAAAPAEALAPAPSATQRWARVRAARSFVFQVLHESWTPWGRQALRRQGEWAAEVARAHVERESDRRVLEAATLTASDTDFLDGNDRRLLSALQAHGYFPALPVNRNLGYHQGLDGPCAYSVPGDAGRTYLVGDRLGDFFGGLLPADTAERHATVQAWSQGAEPTDHVDRVYTRWFILLHETTHCDYANRVRRFDPSPERMRRADAEALNRWVFGALAVGHPHAGSLLDENHADVYAAMLLLEATGHDPRARAVLQQRLEERRNGREQADQAFLDAQTIGPVSQRPFPDIHCSDWALARALDAADRWRGQAPNTLRALALRFASDGLLDFADPSRLGPRGEPLGRALAENLVPTEPDPLMLRKHVLECVRAHVFNTDPLAWLARGHAGHPVTTLVRQAWSHALPMLKQELAQPLESSGSGVGIGPAATVADGIRGLNTDAHMRIDRLLQRADSPLYDQSAQRQRLAADFHADRSRLRRALGLSPEPSDVPRPSGRTLRR